MEHAQQCSVSAVGTRVLRMVLHIFRLNGFCICRHTLHVSVYQLIRQTAQVSIDEMNRRCFAGQPVVSVHPHGTPEARHGARRAMLCV